MGGRLRTVGIAVAALSLLLMAGPATLALADGPDTAHVQYTSGWQGLGDEMHPVAPSPQAQTAPPVQPATTSRANSGSSTETLAVALGLGLAALIGIGLTVTFRKRTRIAV